MATKKSQVSIEFIMLFSFMFLVFLLFFVFIQERRLDVQRDHNLKLLQDVAAVIDSEVKLALAVDDSYVRNFTLPPVLLSKRYNLTLERGENASKLFIKYADGSFGIESFVRLPNSVNITNISAGNNVIFRRHGMVYIDSRLPD